MIRAIPKPPHTQRTFVSVWGELDYLCRKIQYWLYTRNQKTSAGRYAVRLKKLLKKLPENDLAILREEGLALLHELTGEVDVAIVHREREIRLMERLHKEASSPRYDDPTKAYLLQGRGDQELRARREILANLRAERAETGSLRQPSNGKSRTHSVATAH